MEMQNLYPLFAGNRILKKEMLWAVRDRSFVQAELEYREYGDGMISGCGIRVEGNRIIVEPGIIKYGGFIYFLPGEESIEYCPSERETVLKMYLGKDAASPDYVCYHMNLALESGDALDADGFEVCRYKLQEGAVLRAVHKNFGDMETEYDTLNYIHALWGGVGGRALAPAITRRFAREILGTEGCRPEDVMFAYFCLDRTGTVSMDILTDYLARKNGRCLPEMADNQTVFREMCTALERMGKTEAAEYRGNGGRRRIIVE